MNTMLLKTKAIDENILHKNGEITVIPSSSKIKRWRWVNRVWQIRRRVRIIPCFLGDTVCHFLIFGLIVHNLLPIFSSHESSQFLYNRFLIYFWHHNKAKIYHRSYLQFYCFMNIFIPPNSHMWWNPVKEEGKSADSIFWIR